VAGILVIKSVVLGGPTDKMHLEPRNLLFRVNGELVTQFLKLETVLDESIGKTYRMSDIADHAVMDIYKYINKHSELVFILKFFAMKIYNEVVSSLLLTAVALFRFWMIQRGGQWWRNWLKK